MPQPYLVPVSPAFSRIAHNSGVSGSTSTSIILSLIVRFAIFGPLDGLVPRLQRNAGLELGTVQIKKLRFAAKGIFSPLRRLCATRDFLLPSALEPDPLGFA